MASGGPLEDPPGRARHGEGLRVALVELRFLEKRAAVPRERPQGGATAAGGPRGPPGQRERVPGVLGALGPAGVRWRTPPGRARPGEPRGSARGGPPALGVDPGGPPGPSGGAWRAGVRWRTPRAGQGMVKGSEWRLSSCGFWKKSCSSQGASTRRRHCGGGSARSPRAEGEGPGAARGPGAGGGPLEVPPGQCKAWWAGGPLEGVPRPWESIPGVLRGQPGQYAQDLGKKMTKSSAPCGLVSRTCPTTEPCPRTRESD